MNRTLGTPIILDRFLDPPDAACPDCGRELRRGRCPDCAREDDDELRHQDREFDAYLDSLDDY
ncbi:MAG: hypothetical protein V1755_05660 [Chloroflexota bacterium]